MKYLILAYCALCLSLSSQAQLYFPPVQSADWDTISPASLGWCTNQIDELYTFLDSNNTKAFILLKDGKIVLERYFDSHTDSSLWYWASAGKGITAMLVGIAQQENLLSITDPTSQYLGPGWTNTTPTQEAAITIRDQLTMTSGLDDGVTDPFCTVDSCLVYKADAGTRWAYHNGPYTLLDSVLQQATGTFLNTYTTQKIKAPTGMDGFFLRQGFNRVYYSTARSMARFGLLTLNEGNWNGTPVLTDTSYFREMVTTSQPLNQAYGYLWWLNGKSSFRVPQSQAVFPGIINPSAPNDMIAAIGKNGQFINVVPSENLVWIRMGDAPDNSLVPFLLNDQIWDHLNNLPCVASHISDQPAQPTPIVYPNPAIDHIRVTLPYPGAYTYRLFSTTGQVVREGSLTEHGISVSHLVQGLYYLEVIHEGERSVHRVQVHE